MDPVDPTETPELSTADIRRNLRRKKILESAKTRLEKLNGKSAGVELKEPDATEENGQYSDPEVEPDIPVPSPALQGIFANGFLGQPQENLASKEAPNIFIRSRAHIFLASIIGYILSGYGLSSLFLPAGLIIIMEIIYFKGPQRSDALSNSVFPSILLFAGPGLNQQIQKLTTLLSITLSLLVDLAINIFCVCAINYTLSILNEKVVNVVE